VTVREMLGGFVQLQRLLERRIALRREHDTPPPELAELRARFAHRHDRLADRRARRVALETDLPGLQRDVELLQEEREHFRKQKSQVTNMKQLSAVVSELDHVETQLKAKEERLLETMQELDSVAQELTVLETESPEERSLREQAEAGWRDRQQASEAELREVERDLRALKRELGEKAWERFEQLWKSRRPNAVVAMEGSTCSCCHADLRPSLVQDVRSLEGLAFCDSCRRLLYDPEQFPA
jgi:predicted  nucleic acid-binding Zn-ribbon protein